MEDPSKNNDAILITGPTASGKSALALRMARERNGVVINADIHPARIGRQIINAVGRNLAQFRIDEIMNPHFLRCSLGLPFAPSVLEVTDQFFLLGIDGYHRIACRLEFSDLPCNKAKLCISIFMLLALPRLSRRLQAVVHLAQ